MFKSVDAQNAACNAVTGLIDQGSLFPSGQLNLLLSDSSTVIANFVLSNPAFQDATDGTAGSNFIPDATALITGIASFFDILNRDASVVWTGTVSSFTGSGDFRLNSVSIFQDATITLTNIVYMVPAGFTNIGEQGTTGLQGPTGARGLTGMGLPGSTGLCGPTGTQGQTGIGPQGVTGLIGVTGAFGGPQGDQGNTGLQGPTGINGQTGAQGFTGIGDQGGTGLQGPTGVDGQTGVQGQTGFGIQGSTGLQGPTGVEGQTGVQGQTGIGDQGVTGLIGSTGAFGGPQGVTGLIGSTGAFGGPQGVTGLQGLTGATGAQGTTGILASIYGEIYNMIIPNSPGHVVVPGTYSQLINAIPGFSNGITADSSSHLVIGAGNGGTYLASYFVMGQTNTTPDNISCSVFVNGSDQSKTVSETWYSAVTEGLFTSQSKQSILQLASDASVDLRVTTQTTSQTLNLNSTSLTLLKIG